MRRNCLVAIAVWIALFAVYSFLLFHKGVPFDGALLGGGVMSFLVGLGLAMMNGARFAMRDRAALARFRRGERPRDGQLAAVSGEIRAAFEPLRAPFSGQECVVYRYDVGPPHTRNRNLARDYVGFAFAKCAIHSQHGTFAIGTFPVLNGFPEQRFSSPQAFVGETAFEEFSNVLLLAKYTLQLHEQPPPVRVDWQLGHPSGGALEGLEAIVPSGTQVTAYGRYSASANALVAGTKSEGYVRLYRGSTTTIPPAAISQLVTGIVLIVVANVGLWLVLANIATL